jgi:hypothetical protein
LGAGFSTVRKTLVGAAVVMGLASAVLLASLPGSVRNLGRNRTVPSYYEPPWSEAENNINAEKLR